jgi:hypothetical protein
MDIGNIPSLARLIDLAADHDAQGVTEKKCFTQIVGDHQ